MKKANLEEAIAEAERFLDKAHAASYTMPKKNESYWEPSPARAACKRASLDLTKALAKLRIDK